MRVFKDKTGRRWELDVNPASIKRVRDLLGVDLYQTLNDEKILLRLRSDIEFLINVLYAFCSKQAKELNLTDEQFGEIFNGQAIDDATTAFTDELIDFFPSAPRRLLRAATDQMQAETERILERTIRKLPSASSGDSPESPGSIPDLTKSAS